MKTSDWHHRRQGRFKFTKETTSKKIQLKWEGLRFFTFSANKSFCCMIKIFSQVNLPEYFVLFPEVSICSSALWSFFDDYFPWIVFFEKENKTVVLPLILLRMQRCDSVPFPRRTVYHIRCPEFLLWEKGNQLPIKSWKDSDRHSVFSLNGMMGLRKHRNKTCILKPNEWIM